MVLSEWVSIDNATVRNPRKRPVSREPMLAEARATIQIRPRPVGSISRRTWERDRRLMQRERTFTS